MSSGLAVTKVQREQIEAAQAVFAPWGLKTEAVMGGSHAKLLVTDPRGKVWPMTITCSPRYRTSAATYARQQANRLLRRINDELGVTRLR